MNKLSKLLEDRGIKQRWLAQNLGVSDATISKALAGERSFKNKQIEKIAFLLGVEIEHIIDNVEDGVKSM